MRVTAFVTTVGAQTFDACMRSLEGQACLVDVIANVTPWAEAQNEMLRRCTTELFVQVDEDMILRPDAIESLTRLIDGCPPDVVMACAPLWDVDLEMCIYGTKIYRHALVRGIPFERHVLGDTHDREVWARHGLAWDRLPRKPEHVVGDHGTDYTPAQAFRRWRGMWQRHRMTGKAAWIEPWLDKLGARYRRSGSRRDLFAFLGAAIGATEPLWSQEAGPDATRPDELLAELEARFPAR